MSMLTPIIILVLVALILVTMQLTPGIFTLFYHYALGKNSRKKADDLSLDFILGTETFTAFIWFILYTLFHLIFCRNNLSNFDFIPWLLAGLLAAEAVLTTFFYFRSSKSTALFITRRTAKSIIKRIQKTHSRSDAFLLGFTSGLPELIFTLPLYLLVIYELAFSTFLSNSLIIIFLVVLVTLPLFTIRTLYRTGQNLATIERLRIKFKPLFRFIIPLSFLLLVIIIITCLGAIHG